MAGGSEAADSWWFFRNHQEVQEFLARHQALRDDQGRQRVVRNGYLPERTIQTGLGDIEVKAPRARDREKEIKFSSAILPPYLRRTKTIEELLPWLYLKGVSTGDFSEALTALLPRDALGLSASTISRLKDSWADEHGRWSRRSLVNKHYVYLWVDGVQERQETLLGLPLRMLHIFPRGSDPAALPAARRARRLRSVLPHDASAPGSCCRADPS
jgi:hypothetical protein